jgi:hypothetical protein
MHIVPAYAPFLAVEDSTTTSVAEDSIITSGGVKISQSRMSFFARSTGNSCFSFDQSGGEMQATADEWLDQLPRALCTMASTRRRCALEQISEGCCN